MVDTYEDQYQEIAARTQGLDVLLAGLQYSEDEQDPTVLARQLRDLSLQIGVNPFLYLYSDPSQESLRCQAYLSQKLVESSGVQNQGAELDISVVNVGSRRFPVDFANLGIDCELKSNTEAPKLYAALVEYVRSSKFSLTAIQDFLKTVETQITAQNLTAIIYGLISPVYYNSMEGILFTNWGDCDLLKQHIDKLVPYRPLPYSFDQLKELTNYFVDSDLVFGVGPIKFDDLLAIPGINKQFQELLANQLDAHDAYELFTTPLPQDCWLRYFPGLYGTDIEMHLINQDKPVILEARMCNGSPYEFVIDGFGIKVAIPLIKNLNGSKTRSVITVKSFKDLTTLINSSGVSIEDIAKLF